MKAAITLVLLLVLSVFSTTASFAQETCSSGGTLEELSTTLLNDTDGDVTIHWIDPDCVEQEGSPIPVGEELEFITYDGHEFIFRSASGDEIGGFTVTTEHNAQVLPISGFLYPPTCSSSGTNEELIITLLNDTDGDVTVHWISFECVEQEGTLIPVGEELEFITYDGHEFVFRDAAGDLIGSLTVTTADNEQVLPISGLLEEWITIEPEATAEPAGYLTIGEEGEAQPLPITFNGHLVEDVAMDHFALEAQEGVLYVITLVSEDYDTYLYILDEDGTELASDDDSYTDLNAIIAFTAPADGTYTIGLDSYRDGSQGDYTLSIASPDTVINSFLSAGAGSTPVSLEVEEGEGYFVFANSESFDTVLSVLDENGAEVAANDDFGGTTNSFTDFTASSTGTYTISVNGFAEESSGEFEILIGSFQQADQQ